MGQQILIVNPNTCELVTELLASEARRIAGGRIDISVVTAPYGTPVLQSSDDFDCARAAVAELIVANPEFDAAIIGDFGDPGLDEVQATVPMPVFGLGRSGLLRAADGGRSFGIVTLGRKTRPTIERAVAQVGLGSQVVALHFIDADAMDLIRDRGTLVEAAAAALSGCIEAGADAVLFGGAPFAGIEALLGSNQTVPVIDGMTSAMLCALEAFSLRHG